MKKPGKKSKKRRPQKTALKQDKINTLLTSASLFLDAKQYDKAEMICRKILTASPQNMGAIQLSGTIALISKQPERAIQFLKKALGVDPNIPEVHCNLGLAHEILFDFFSAQKCYQKALEVQPDFFEALRNLGSLKLKMFLNEDAYIFLKKAVENRPQDYETLLLLGQAASKTSRLKESISCYELYLSHCQPFSPDFLSNTSRHHHSFTSPGNPIGRHIPDSTLHIKAKLADLYERSNLKQKARQSANEVLRHTPQHYMASLIIARLDRQKGRLNRALERLEQFVDNTTTKDNDILAEIMAERGTILDRMNQYDDAFDSFISANKIMGQTRLASQIDTTPIHHTISGNRDYFKKNYIQQEYEPPETGDQPVFLVGFPRSGTTLVEHIIASRTGFNTSDELPIIDDIIKNISTLLGKNIRLPDDLGTLLPGDREKIQLFYWHQIENSLGIIPNKNQFLDKQPLNLLHLGFIEHIFPGSKIIILLRDPRDVCLSNFFQMFGLNEAMIHFLDLKNTVDFYSMVMNLWMTYKETIRLNYLEIRYEDLVDKQEDTIEMLRSFILPYADTDHHKGIDHMQCAAKRIISTPSYHDVIQPIYTRAVGRWKNYRKHMEPHSGTLERFIKAFGYER